MSESQAPVPQPRAQLQAQPQLLLIDNYDSFTYNLYHLILAACPGAKVSIKRNDAITIEGIQALAPKAIFLSPGPCTPEESGICPEVVRHFHQNIPIFGICLGYQVICEVFGGKVVVSGSPMHGKVSQIFHSGGPIYANVPKQFAATRYHSLVLSKDTLPDSLRCCSTSEDGFIMSVHHKYSKVCGVQYHPESISSEYGRDIISNFLSYSLQGQVS